MGDAKFASSFIQYCPILLVLLTIFNIFDVYGRILAGLGLSRFKFSENFNDEKIEEGRLLLQKGKVLYKTSKLMLIKLVKLELSI